MIFHRLVGEVMSLNQKENTDQIVQKQRMKGKEPYLLLFPAFLLILLFFGYPIIDGLRLAFYHYVLTDPGNIFFSGLENFKELLKDGNFLLVLKNSIIWVVASVGLQLVLGLTLALALSKNFRGKNLYQAIVFLPWAVSGFLIGMIFKWMFNEHNGLINYVLKSLGIIDHSIPFLALPNVSIFTAVVAMIWYGVPFFAIMVLAALQSIPQEVHEAAALDGAGGFKKLTKITIPYIKKTLIITTLLRVIWVFNSADIIYIMTNGGPANTSHNLPSYIFSTVFYTMDFGQASAAGVIMIILLVIYSVIFLKVTKFDKAGDF
ncbi:multiple sugar transport system permease protein [Bacillus sp. SLBN-46]|uniref:carbohydrate ABC transporter permease n=1 Tax=Bacillus sp. SLBN-46 TaxID=3042283 RepID=UPI002860DF05|nr:sugar ABC transporter permease [Bacillus sp. SLBN-46]MDR6123106.1 multiple sugar transport system permease protein [Bacillus sp. SLBN-46]